MVDTDKTIPAPAVESKETMASLMEELGDHLLPFVEGDTIEATVLAVGSNRIWIDVSGQSLGFIPEKEITGPKSALKPGDKIFCTVISMEDSDGNVVLSMKQADREKYWQEMENRFKTGDPIAVRIVDANKGGLTTDIGGIQGFLPVSQLAPSNYPRVSGGDKDEILNRLRRFIGTEMMVKVINCDREGNKLIFSERAVKETEIKEKIDRYQVGDKVQGKVTGVVDFGLFVSLDHQVEGLIHISEVSWNRVTELHKMFKVGDEVEAIIISIEDNRISLSLKRLLPDPWVKAASKYSVNDVVEGEITKITPFGAFVSLSDQIDGLVHVSELSDKHIADPGQVVELGKRYKFKIISIEAENHRLGLSLKAIQTPDSQVEPEEKSKVKQEIPEAPDVEETVIKQKKKGAKSAAKE